MIGKQQEIQRGIWNVKAEGLMFVVGLWSLARHGLPITFVIISQTILIDIFRPFIVGTLCRRRHILAAIRAKIIKYILMAIDS